MYYISMLAETTLFLLVSAAETRLYERENVISLERHTYRKQG